MSENKNELKERSDKDDRVLRALIILSCVCVLIQVYSITHRISALISISNLVLSLSWVFYGLFAIIQRIFQKVLPNSLKALGIVVFSMMSLVIGLTRDSATVGQLGRLVGFLVLPIMIYCISAVKVSEKTRKIVLIANVITSIQYILLYFSDLRYVFTTEYGTHNIDSVTLGFANPNQTAIMLFSALILLLVAAFFFKNLIFRIFLIADMAFIIFIIFETNSRTATLLSALLLIAVPFVIKKRIPKIVTELCMLAPLIYLLLALVLEPLFSNFKILGDSIFTGRDSIFARYFEKLDIISFFFGNMAEFKFENLHNAYISIAASLGIIVFVLYYAFIRKALLTSYKKGNFPKFAAVAYCGLLCVMIYSSVEGGFLIGGSTYGALIAMMFLMMPSDTEETKAVAKQ